MEKYGVIRGGLLLLLVAGISLVTAGYWIPLKARLAQYLLESSWQESLITGKPVRPWPWADTYPVGRLAVKRLGVDLIILEGESGSSLAFGPGRLLQGSGIDDDGQIILAGHRDTSFAFLQDVTDGDLLELEGHDGVHLYKVESIRVVPAGELFFDAGSPDLLSLITCYPFGGLIPHPERRYVVTATRRIP